MNEEKQRSICLIGGGLDAIRRPFQPWHYLFHVAGQLAGRGHRLTLISDRSSQPAALDLPPGVALQALHSVANPGWRANHPLQQAIAAARPDLILWHLDLNIFGGQRFAGPPGVPVVGLITSPLHLWEEVASIGRTKLLRGGRRSIDALSDVLLSRALLRRSLERSPDLQAIVVQTQTTARHLAGRRVWSRPVHVIPPGVDALWHSGQFRQAAADLRSELGWEPDHKVVLYHSQPLPYRGLERFIQSFIMLHHCRPTSRLLTIDYDHPDAHPASHRELEHSLAMPEVAPFSRVISRPLDQEELAAHVAVADAIAFPYQLLQTDAPLHLLQARAMAKPLVTTNVGCLPELVGPGAQLPTGRYGVVPLASALDQALYGRPSTEAIVPFTRSWDEVGDDWDRLVHQYQVDQSRP